MATVTGLTVIKSFTYRGQTGEEWSNTYHFRDAPPATSAAWKAMADGFISHERHIYPPTSKVVRAYGYNDDSDNAVSVWSYDYELTAETVAGDLPALGIEMAGDQACMCWWRLDQKNSRGKWVYLRKYLHDGRVAASGGDSIETNYRNAVSQFQIAISPAQGAYWGGVRSRKSSAPIITYDVSPYVTTRTLKRRGKRPLANP